MLYDAGIRDFPFRIVNYRNTLIVFSLKPFSFKLLAPVLKVSKREVEVGIKSTCVKNLVCQG